MDADGCHVQLFVFLHRRIVGGAAVIAHHTEHVLAILLEVRERTQMLRHLCGCRVAFAGEDSRERTADGTALCGIVRNTHLHEHRAQVCVAEPECAEAVRQICDLTARELRHEDGNFQHDGPEACCVLVALDFECSMPRIKKLEQVQRCQVASRVVQEHVLTARVTCIEYM